ncbi:MAG: hypothetical protein RIM99_02245 [Cyclobacteriaceae bacterium]
MSLNAQQDDVEILFWGEQELEWTHFRGDEDMLAPVKGAPVDAMSKIAVVFERDSYKGGKWCFRAQTIFVTKESWCRHKGEALLQHERLHFDIFELIARRLRKFADEQGEELTRSLFDQHFARLETELDQFNREYDQETGYGARSQSQLEWDKKVKSALDSLLEYNESVLICMRE